LALTENKEFIMHTTSLSTPLPLSIQLQQQVDAGLAAWPEWNLQDIHTRAELISAWVELLVQDDALGTLAAEMAKYQKQQALSLLAETKVMPGPTGEVNELYSAGRGLFVVTMADMSLTKTPSAISALIAHISAALLAGNCILIALPERELERQTKLVSSLHQAGFADNVVQGCDYSQLEQLIAAPQIAGVAYTGDVGMAQKLNAILATRTGLLAQLVTELSEHALTTVTDNHFVLRFITERTRTINITAVGGNATLLELGGGDH